MKTEEKKEKCTACKGVGSIHYIGRKYRTPCPTCEGTGIELPPTPPKVEVTEEITDKDRIDWLEKGHAVVGIASGGNQDKTMFSANFHEQDWEEYPTVREAIDAAMKKEKNENQSTKEAAN